MKVWLFSKCILFLGVLGFVLILQGCSAHQGKKHFVLGEQLWTDQKYGAAILEFEKVYQREPRSKLGQAALYRAAMTQALFLKQYSEALQKLKTFVQFSSDLNLVWQAQLEIGEILYHKIELYDQAITHYESLILARPDAQETPELLFRVAKSEFFLFRFDQALEKFQKLRKLYPQSIWAEKAAYEIGRTYYTRGESQKHSSDFQQAIQTFQNFLEVYPKSSLLPDAQFGIASCFEELDRHTDALSLYTSLQKTYPSPRVIQIKIARLKKRIHQIN